MNGVRCAEGGSKWKIKPRDWGFKKLGKELLLFIFVSLARPLAVRFQAVAGLRQPVLMALRCASNGVSAMPQSVE